jgi:hypothetical protein
MNELKNKSFIAKVKIIVGIFLQFGNKIMV